MTSQPPGNKLWQDGFTIIETMIVLAIAGLIMTIVFEALPALQRGSRNNQRKQDVQTILQAVSHWELADSGNMPTTSDNYLQYYKSKLTYYAPADITLDYSDLGQASSAPANVNNLDKVVIANHAKCSATTTGSLDTTGAGYNDVVALYALETASGPPNSQCQHI